MRTLGCPQMVSMENFRTPNFELVAELLFWLLRRYDPGSTLQDDIDTPADRMRFLESVAHILFVKARLKLNIKRLYAADGRAVHELLKVTELLFAASRTAHTDAEEIARRTDSALEALGHMDKTVKRAREAVSDISQAGEKIYSHLFREAEISSARQQVLAQHFDKEDVQLAVQVIMNVNGFKTVQRQHRKTPVASDAIDQLVEEDEQLQAQIENLYNSKAESEDKLKRKQAECDRMEQRLMQLKGVSAPHQDEVNAVFNELQGINGLDEEERIKAEEAKLERLRQRIEDHDWKLIRGHLSVHENEVANDLKELDGTSSDDSLGMVSAGHGRTLIAQRPQGPGDNVQGTILASNTAYGSDGDEGENTDMSQVEHFEAMSKEFGFSADGGITIDDEDDDEDIFEDEF